ncbi:hypothetical protein IJS18_01780 [Candidatus Saccharibacteria bacterium]|nr:hypothetical protein [Candidatus Saccharibacteria bacterium]
MAKEVAIEKRAKISQAQQYMLLAVLGAAIFLGVAVSMIFHFINQISFNVRVIAEEEKAIVAYSNAIRDIGVCKKPHGSIYSEDELKHCNPDTIDVSTVPGTLRANIMDDLAADDSLNSVPKESSSCINPYTGKKYSYDELNDIYNKADTDDDLIAASELILSCSALRIIPDALPAFKNEEALLSSLNKIFLLTGIEPETLTPTGSSGVSSIGTNLQSISVRLSVESNTATTVNFLENVERSIREFNIDRATIEWASNDTLILQAQAEAFYMQPSQLMETNQTVKVEQKGGKK